MHLGDQECAHASSLPLDSSLANFYPSPLATRSRNQKTSFSCATSQRVAELEALEAIAAFGLTSKAAQRLL